MKKIFLSLLLMFLLPLTGCMTANQLAAEKSFYEAMVSMQKQTAAQPLVQIIPADKDKPIIMQNVASFTVFAPPQSSDGPRLTQYVQKDYVAPWLNIVGMAVPWLGAWGIVKATSDAIANIPHTNNSSVVNTNSHNSASTPTSYNNTVSGAGNVANIGGTVNQATATPTVVVVEQPVIVKP